MNANKTAALKKRTVIDLVASGIIGAAAAVAGIVFLFKYADGAPKQYLTNAVYSIALAAEVLLLCLILIHVRIKGTPFTKTVIWILRIMAVILFLTGCMPSFVEVSSDPSSFAVSTTFGFQNFLVFGLGAVIGVISEIFVYGRELQEDNDLIA
ncbi:MAG: hypothetical protein IJ071_09480 [Ruminococcus sp.]|nr:hypothetical protein [Ruminococcus sp.]